MAVTFNLSQVLRRLRTRRRSAVGRLRALGAPERMVPGYLILGVQKGGTTSLYQYLTAHPSVAAAARKEIRFFGESTYREGLSWYLSHFPTREYQRRYEKEHGTPLITGEASPKYFVGLGRPQRIMEVLPDVKLLLVLRNPVDRAYSHFQHTKRRGREHRTFDTAMEQEIGILEETRQALGRELDETTLPIPRGYLQFGFYAKWLDYWLTVFPREQIHVVNSERLFSDPGEHLQPVFRFLGIPEWRSEEYGRHMVGSYNEMEPALRKRLLGYMAPHNERLYEILGDRYEWDR
jgi:hypothetical protein